MLLQCTIDNVVRMAFYLCGLPPEKPQSGEDNRTNFSRGVPYKMPEEYASKLSKSSNTREVQDTVTFKRGLRKCDDSMGCGVLHGVPEQDEKDIRLKLRKSE